MKKFLLVASMAVLLAGSASACSKLSPFYEKCQTNTPETSVCGR